MNSTFETLTNRILQGNCLEILPAISDCSVEAVVTDPPYSSGGLILDPFAGSGTTCLGVFLEGRDFLGVEMDPGYAEVAYNKLTEAGYNAEVK